MIAEQGQLVRLLHDHGYGWSLAAGQCAPGGKTTLRIVRGDEVIERQYKWVAMESHSIDTIIENTLMRHDKHHRLLLELRKSRGDTAVELHEYALEELGPLTHVALRKLTDSNASCILWNAINSLHHSDWTAVLDAAREKIKAIQTDRLTRRAVGHAIRDGWTQASDHPARIARSSAQAQERRGNEHELALQMFHFGCRATEDSEWVWALTAHVCREGEVEQMSLRASNRMQARGMPA